jgi:hypothetical protein
MYLGVEVWVEGWELVHAFGRFYSLLFGPFPKKRNSKLVHLPGVERLAINCVDETVA